MQPSKYHTGLLRQIQTVLGQSPSIPPQFQTLLEQVSDSYEKFDEEHKLMEAKVALRTEQLIASTSSAYSFLDSLNMGFIMCDVNPEVVLTNLAVRRMLATKSSGKNEPPSVQSYGTEWELNAIDARLQPEVQLKELIIQSLATNQPLECPEVNCGQHVLHVSIAPMVNEVSPGDKQQLGVIVLVEDITEQKILERSKDEFLSIAAHELRTPLTAIRGNTSLIRKYYSTNLANRDMVEMVDDIHESSVRLIAIVNDFLDVSALEQGKIIMNPEAFSLEEVIGDVSRELENLCQSKGLALVRDSSVAAAPLVMADKQRTKQVIYNLVGNAVKFTERGTITISTRADDDFVYTLVKDTGRGMSVESQRLLFRKFQQTGSLLTRDTTKGTGLGLYISKLIVELSGGTIGLESSELGRGSSFVFSLPRSQRNVQSKTTP